MRTGKMDSRDDLGPTSDVLRDLDSWEAAYGPGSVVAALVAEVHRLQEQVAKLARTIRAALDSDDACGWAYETIGRILDSEAIDKPLPDAAEGTGETDSHDDPEMTVIAHDDYVALIGLNQASYALDETEEDYVAPGEATPMQARRMRDAMVRDLAAPSNGENSSRPFPAADRFDAMYSSAASRCLNTAEINALLAAADDADKAAGIVRVDTRDEVLHGRIAHEAEIIIGLGLSTGQGSPDCFLCQRERICPIHAGWAIANAVRAALRGEQR